jgi:cysteinyl-tRNA synthetase
MLYTIWVGDFMRIFNTLTNQIEPFKPIEENIVSMYVCGPTVYNYIHIGNARPVIFFDTVRRYFEYKGYTVKFVSNFTDIDDKIITKSIELGKTEQEVAEFFINAFLSDVDFLNSDTSYQAPRVTNYMGHIVDYIKKLIEKGYAYEINGDVYFRVTKLSDYGVLSNRQIDDLISGSRVEENTQKENPLDFTLWKKTSEGIQFDSPFGQGRPGWHTECVAMIDDIFGGVIDIHGGGMDLMFPHHENEIAQAEAMHHHKVANVWMHNGRLNVDGKKMSKSDGKLILVKDLTVDANAFRLYTLSTHYRSPINYNDDVLAGYSKEWEKISRAIKQCHFELDINDLYLQTFVNTTEIQSLKEAFEAHMENDFNTANAITVLQDLVKLMNQRLRQKGSSDSLNEVFFTTKNVMEVLGLRVNLIKSTAEDKLNYIQWLKAREEKDFETADIFRQRLQRRGLL